MQMLLLGTGGRASPSAPSILSQDGLTEVTAGFDPVLLPLMLVIAVATALTLKIIDIAVKSIAGAFKSIAETGLALAGFVGIILMIILAMTVMLRFPT